MKKIAGCVVLLFSQMMGFAQTENAELPAIKSPNANDFFIPAAVCAKFKVTQGKGDEWMKVYNDLEPGAKLQRVNDIRWEAKSAAEAAAWYKNNMKMLSEGSKDVTAQFAKPVGVKEWNVYEASDAMKKMMASLGVPQNQYIYTFTVDKYVAKIFMGTNDATSLKESWSFAKEGLIALLKASGNPKMAGLVL